MNTNQLLNRLMELGAQSARIVQRSGANVTVSFVMTRNNYARYISPIIDPNGNFGELSGLEDLQKGTMRGTKTEGGLYRYDVIFYLWNEEGKPLTL